MAPFYNGEDVSWPPGIRSRSVIAARQRLFKCGGRSEGSEGSRNSDPVSPLHGTIAVETLGQVLQHNKCGGSTRPDMREMEGSGGGEERGTVTTWVDKNRTIYDRATRHPFVLSIRDGTVDFSSFKRWLGQDYIFVREFVPFVASVLLKACGHPDDGDGSEMEVILSGVASLNDELSWFKKEASKWNVHLSSVAPQQANLEYCRFLKSLRQPEVDFAVSITAFWAIEMVYQRSFALCLESDSNTPPELLEACQRWGSAGFEQYCCFIQRIADRCLAKATDETLKHAEDAFVCVLEHEINFWNMSSGS